MILGIDLADSPAQALAAARLRRPDLITVDYKILNGTGVEAVSGIIQNIGPVPVVFVTGNADVVRRQISAPIVDKPISLQALRDACGQAGAKPT